MTWLVLAPVSAGVAAVSWIVEGVHKYRRGDASRRELFEAIGLSSLIAGIGATSMLHPLVAAVLLVVLVPAGAAEVVKAAKRLKG